GIVRTEKTGAFTQNHSSPGAAAIPATENTGTRFRAFVRVVAVAGVGPATRPVPARPVGGDHADFRDPHPDRPDPPPPRPRRGPRARRGRPPRGAGRRPRPVGPH